MDRFEPDVNQRNKISQGGFLNGDLFSMSRRDWVKYAAYSGLIISAFIVVGVLGWGLFTDYQKKNSDSRDKAAKYDTNKPQEPIKVICAPSKKNVSVCHVQQPDTGATDEHTKTDLKAQQDVAEWTFASVLLSVAGLVFTAIGIAFVYASLRETRRAIKVSEDASMNEARAYVHVERVELYWGDYDGSKPKIAAIVKNSGSTPAKWFEITYKIFILDLNSDGSVKNCPEFYEIDFSKSAKSIWNAIGGSSELACGVGTIEERADLASSYSRRNDIAINVAGTVKYQTYFGEIFETQYWFFRRPVPTAVIEESETRDWRTVRKENPIPLTRISKPLETYRRLN